MLEQYRIWAQTAAFGRRLETSRLEVSRLVATGARFVVSSSWGKDSCALVELVRDVTGERFDVAHLQSEYELPGYERIIQWAHGFCDVTNVPSSLTLSETIEWLRTNGLDFEREKDARAGVRRKAGAMLDWVHSRGYTCQLLGMRAAESKARRKCFQVRGLTYLAHGLIVSNPIGWWDTRDVWAYIVSRGVPWHSLYDCETHGLTREKLRNAGWLTVPGGVGGESDARLPWLRKHFPAQFELLVTEFPHLR